MPEWLEWIMLSVLVALVFSTGSTEEKIRAQESKIADLETRIDDLESRVDDIENTLDNDSCDEEE